MITQHCLEWEVPLGSADSKGPGREMSLFLFWGRERMRSKKGKQVLRIREAEMAQCLKTP